MYYLGFAFFYLLSLLPFWVLYRLSDLVAFILCHLVGYRRKTIEENIRQSFPQYTHQQVQRTKRKFYVNFTDNWMETIKLLSMSKASLQKRATGNFDIFTDLQKNGQTAALITGHFFNWEYLNVAISAFQPMDLICVYMPITDKRMDRMFKFLRARFGANLMAATQLTREIIPWRKKQYVIGLVSDQSPSNPTNAHWLQFLNRPTAYLTGAERNAQVFNQIPIYITVHKPKRGYYHYHFEKSSLSTEERKSTGAITLEVARVIEKNILQEPDIYLWSHRRWKHPWRNDYAKYWVDKDHPIPSE